MSDFSTDLKDTLSGIDFDPEALRAKYRQERDKRIRGDGNEPPRSPIDLYERSREIGNQPKRKVML